MRITVLADNTVAVRNARGEHGLSFSVETGENCLLFDTGQGLVLADNAHALNVDLDAVDTVVLSHGHYDHTGGLAGVLRDAAGPLTVHAHPDALLPKYKRDDGKARDIGMPAESREAIHEGRCRFIPSRESAQIAPGIRTTGEIPRLHPRESITEPFCLDPAGCRPDPLLDDQALVMETMHGTVILLGCAHCGIINTLDHIQQLMAGKPIHAVMGGMHLGSATESRMEWTLRELHRFRISLLVPMHCTGQKANAALWAAFPHVCQSGGAGAAFDF